MTYEQLFQLMMEKDWDQLIKILTSQEFNHVCNIMISAYIETNHPDALIKKKFGLAFWDTNLSNTLECWYGKVSIADFWNAVKLTDMKFNTDALVPIKSEVITAIKHYVIKHKLQLAYPLDKERDSFEKAALLDVMETFGAIELTDRERKQSKVNEKIAGVTIRLTDLKTDKQKLALGAMIDLMLGLEVGTCDITGIGRLKRLGGRAVILDPFIIRFPQPLSVVNAKKLLDTFEESGIDFRKPSNLEKVTALQLITHPKEIITKLEENKKSSVVPIQEKTDNYSNIKTQKQLLILGNMIDILLDLEPGCCSITPKHALSKGNFFVLESYKICFLSPDSDSITKKFTTEFEQLDIKLIQSNTPGEFELITSPKVVLAKLAGKDYPFKEKFDVTNAEISNLANYFVFSNT